MESAIISPSQFISALTGGIDNYKKITGQTNARVKSGMISNVTVNGDIIFDNKISFGNPIIINNCLFQGTLEFTLLEIISNFSIINSNIRGNIILGPNSVFKKNLSIQNTNIKAELIELECTVLGSLNFDVIASIKLLKIIGGDFNVVNFKFGFTSLEDDYRNESIFEMRSTQIKSKFSISFDAIISKIRLYDIHVKSSGIFTIAHDDVQRWDFVHLHNLGKIIITGVVDSNRGSRHYFHNNKRFRFFFSDMGKTIFHDFNFNSFENLVITHSRIEEIETRGKYISQDFKRISTNMNYNVLFDKNNEKLKGHYEYELTQHFDQLVRVYSDLQLAMKNQGNSFMENEYFRTWQDVKYRYFKQIKKQLSVRASLLLHRYSSDYGRNWFRPFILIIVISLFLFTIYVGFSVQFELKNLEQSISFYIGKYLEFLWPTHKFDFFKKPPGWISIIDFTSRIIIGFLIYQMITAFRAPGKK